MEPVSLDPTTHSDDQIDLSPAPQPQFNLPPAAVDSRSTKAFLALGQVTGKSKEEIANMINSGHEIDFRNQAASAQYLKNLQDKNDLVRRVLDLQQAPLSPDQAKYVEGRATVAQALGQPVPDIDPKTVIEEYFGKKFLEPLSNTESGFIQGSVVGEALKDDPRATGQILALGGKLSTLKNIAITGLERAQSAYEEQGTFSAGVDVAKDLVTGGFYSEGKLRNQVPGTGYFTGLDANLEAQVTALYRENNDPKKFSEKYNIILDGLIKDNPSLAVRFAHAVVGQSADERSQGALGTLLTVGLPVGGLAGKVISRAKNLEAVAKATSNVVKAADEVGKPGAPPVNVINNEAIGNIPEAGVQRATVKAIRDGQNAAEFDKDALEALAPLHRIDVPTTTGSSTDAANRINNFLDKDREAFQAAVLNGQKVNRIPFALASEDKVREYQQVIRDLPQYRGLDSNIVKMGQPFYSEVTKTSFIPVDLVQADGTPFMKLGPLRRFAELHDIPLTEAETTTHTAATKTFNKVAKQLNDRIEAFKAEGPVPTPPAVSKGYVRFYAGADKINELTLFPDAARRYGAVHYVDLKKGTPLEVAGRDGTPVVAKANILKRLGPFEGEFLRQPEINKAQAALDAEFQRQAEVLRQPKGLVPERQGAQIVDNGVGYSLRINHPIDEIHPVMRGNLLDGSQTDIPYLESKRLRDTFKPILGWMRTPGETLSKADIAERVTADHAPKVLFNAVNKTLSTISKLSTRQQQDLRRMLTLSQAEGRHFEDPLEFSTYFRQHIGRGASDRETDAYFAFKMASEQFEALRNIEIVKGKLRLGAQSHTAYMMDEVGVKRTTPSVEGTALNTVPKSGFFMVMSDGKARLTSSLSDTIKEGVEQGRYKAIQILNPNSRPLGDAFGANNQRITHIISEGIETRPLSLNTLSERPAAPFRYRYNMHLKQADVRSEARGPSVTSSYEGDRTVMAIENTKTGNHIAENMNKVRELIRDGKLAEAEVHSNEHLPFDWNQHHGWYKPTVDPSTGRSLPPRLNLDQKIYLVKEGDSIIKMDKELQTKYKEVGSGRFQNNSKHDFLENKTDPDDLYAVVNKGSRWNPLYEYEPARTADPISYLNRSLSRIVKSGFMDDYKDMAQTHWLANAMPFLRADAKQVWHSPGWHFNEPQYIDGISPSTKAVLEVNRARIQRFIGIPNELQSHIEEWTQKVADSISPKLGALLQDSELYKTKDPFAFFRKVTSHMTLGMGNIVQLFTNAATMANIAAISPRSATSALLANMLHGYSRINSSPEILAALDKKASNVLMRFPGMYHFKPGQFLEMRDGFINSGFHNVSGEHSFVDTPTAFKTARSKVGTVLEAGMLPFKIGSELTRTSAYASAYLEWRAVNPVAAFDRAAKQTVLSRASLLDHNMSRAYNSSLHEGVLSTMTQFMTYNLRLAEMMWGKQLGRNEKARLAIVSSAMYGIPLGTIGTFGLPLTDSIRKVVEQYTGYVPGDKVGSTLAMEGLLTVASAYVSGEGDFKKGSLFDFSRTGNKGIDIFKNVFAEDKTVADILGGASLSKLGNTFANMYGSTHLLQSMLSDKPTAFKMSLDTGLDMLNEISSVAYARRLEAAINTSTWMSKNGIALSETDPKSAIFSTIVGAPPLASSEAFVTASMNKDQTQWEHKTIKNFEREMSRAYIALINNDNNLYETHAGNAKWYLQQAGLSQKAISDAFKTFNDSHKTLYDKVNWDRLRKSPADEAITRQEQFSTIQQNKR